MAVTYNTWDSTKDWDSVVFVPGRRIQDRELNELQSIQAYKTQALGGSIYKDGEIISGCQSVVESEDPNTVKMTEGTMFIGGAIRFIQGTEAPHLWFEAKGNEWVGLMERQVLVVPAFEPDMVLGSVEVDNSLLNPATGVPGYGDVGAYRNKRYFDWHILTNWKLVSTIDVTVALRFTIARDRNDRLKFTLNKDSKWEKVLNIQLTPGTKTPEDLVAELNVYPGIEVAIERNRLCIWTSQKHRGALKMEECPNNAAETLGWTYADKLIKIHEYVDGKLRLYTEPSLYSQIYDKIAKERFELEGNFIVSDFNVILKELVGDPNYFLAVITSGVAYVNGYRIETVAPVTIKVPKGRGWLETSAETKNMYQNKPWVFPMDRSFVRSFGAPNAISTVIDHGRYTDNVADIGSGPVRGVQCIQNADAVWSEEYQRYVYRIGPNKGLPIPTMWQYGVHYRFAGTALEWLVTPPVGSYLLAWERTYSFSKGYRTKVVRKSTLVRSSQPKGAPTGVFSQRIGGAASETERVYCVCAFFGDTHSVMVDGAAVFEPQVWSDESYVRIGWSPVSGASAYGIFQRKTFDYSHVATVSHDQSWFHDYSGKLPSKGAHPISGWVDTTGSVDALPYPYVIKNYPTIVKNIGGGDGEWVNGVDYEICDGQTDQSLGPSYIKWLTGGPSDGTSYEVQYGQWNPTKQATLVTAQSFEWLNFEQTEHFHMVFNRSLEVKFEIEEGLYSVAEFCAFVNMKAEMEVAAANDMRQIVFTAPATDKTGAISYEGGHSYVEPKEIVDHPYIMELLGFAYAEVSGMDGLEGDWLGADSYNDYDLIGSFQPAGYSSPIMLRDCLDFRCSGRKPVPSWSNEEKTMVSSIIAASYSYYVGRLDALYVTETGRFFRMGGDIQKYQKPDTPKQYLTVAWIHISPYGLDVKKQTVEVIPQKVFNQQAIKALQTRVDVLEYLNAYDMLTQSALNQETPNYSKQGLLVNPLMGSSRIDWAFEGPISWVNNEDPSEPNASQLTDIQVNGNFGVDPATRTLMLGFQQQQLNLEVGDDEGYTTVSTKSRTDKTSLLKTLTLPYSTKIMVEQLRFTDFVNAAPYEVFNFVGSMTITPSNDVRFDTTYAPALRVDFQGERSNWDGSPLGFQTEWGNWNTMGGGIKVGSDGNTSIKLPDPGTTETISMSRTGSQVMMMPEAITKKTGDFMVDLSALPFVPPRGPLSVGAADLAKAPPLVIKAQNLRPNIGQPDSEPWPTLTFTLGGIKLPVTRLGYKPAGSSWTPSQIDETDTYIKINDGTDQNGKICTDKNGTTIFQVDIPKGVLACGQHEVKLEGKYTGATCTFTGQGYLKTNQEQYLTIDSINLTTESRTEDRNLTITSPPNPQEINNITNVTNNNITNVTNVTNNNITNVTERHEHITNITNTPPSQQTVDPIAQTWYTPGQITFVTGVEVWFRSKPIPGFKQIGMTCQIRNCVNGYPGYEIIAEKTLTVDEISVSEDGSKSTIFQFDEVVSLLASTEYCFALRTTSDQYEIFVAKVGGFDMVTGARIISQPYVGVYFDSPNASAFSMDPNTDIKFAIHCAVFDPLKTDLVFKRVENANAGVISLNATQVLPENTAVKWYYSTDREPFGSVNKTWNGFGILENVELGNIADVVDFMAWFGGTADFTPLVSRERTAVTMIAFKKEGYAMQIPIVLGTDQDGLPIEFNKVRVDYAAQLNGQIVSCWWSPDQKRFIKMKLEGSSTQDLGWVEYHWSSPANRIGDMQASSRQFGDRLALLTEAEQSLLTSFEPFLGGGPGDKDSEIIIEKWDDRDGWVVLGNAKQLANWNELPADSMGWMKTIEGLGAIRFGATLEPSVKGVALRANYEWSSTNIVDRCWILIYMKTNNPAITPKIRNLRTFVLTDQGLE